MEQRDTCNRNQRRNEIIREQKLPYNYTKKKKCNVKEESDTGTKKKQTNKKVTTVLVVPPEIRI